MTAKVRGCAFAGASGFTTPRVPRMRKSSRRCALERKLRDILQRREEESAFVKVVGVRLSLSGLDLAPEPGGARGARIETGGLAVGAFAQPIENRSEDGVVRCLGAARTQAPR